MPEISTNHTFAHVDPDSSPVSPESAPADPIPDLRRRGARLQAELIARRACFLPREQQALIAAIYAKGQSYPQLAMLSGKPARRLRREVRRILCRLASPEFIFVAIHLQQWPVTMRRVAETCVLAGEPVRSAARTLHLSLHTVRKHRDMVRLLAAGAVRDPDLDMRSKAG